MSVWCSLILFGIHCREVCMFAQTIRGKVNDPAAVRPVVDRWMNELGPSAVGWLGSTSGITDQGELFTLVRFESEEAARANSDRPEQGEWWAEMQELFDDEATFQDSKQVYVDAIGDLNSAGFVQVMIGQVSDADRGMALMGDNSSWRGSRSDILGIVGADFGDGRFTTTVYFTSEVEAREGERSAMPPEVQVRMSEMVSLLVGPLEYLDLKSPWLDSPKLWASGKGT